MSKSKGFMNMDDFPKMDEMEKKPEKKEPKKESKSNSYSKDVINLAIKKHGK